MHDRLHDCDTDTYVMSSVCPTYTRVTLIYITDYLSSACPIYRTCPGASEVMSPPRTCSSVLLLLLALHCASLCVRCPPLSPCVSVCPCCLHCYITSCTQLTKYTMYTMMCTSISTMHSLLSYIL